MIQRPFVHENASLSLEDDLSYRLDATFANSRNVSVTHDRSWERSFESSESEFGYQLSLELADLPSVESNFRALLRTRSLLLRRIKLSQPVDTLTIDMTCYQIGKSFSLDSSCC